MNNEFSTSDDLMYPCHRSFHPGGCSETNPEKFKSCETAPNDSCERYVAWIKNVNNEKYPGKMCNKFESCFLSAYIIGMAPSTCDCTGTYEEAVERCDFEEEDEE